MSIIKAQGIGSADIALAHGMSDSRLFDGEFNSDLESEPTRQFGNIPNPSDLSFHDEANLGFDDFEESHIFTEVSAKFGSRDSAAEFLDAEFELRSKFDNQIQDEVEMARQKKVEMRITREERDQLIEDLATQSVLSTFRQEVMPQLSTPRERQLAVAKMCEELGIVDSVAARELYREVGAFHPSQRTAAKTGRGNTRRRSNQRRQSK